jgi:hypothetical protein
MKKPDINDFYIREHICVECCMMIPEDHWGLPIPSSDDCSGELRDDDEGYEAPRRLKKTIRRHEDD